MSRFHRDCARPELGEFPEPQKLADAGELENHLFTGRARPGAVSHARHWVALPSRPGASGGGGRGAHLTRLRQAGRGACSRPGAGLRGRARGRAPRWPTPPDPAVRLMLLADADRPEPVRSGARELALFLTPEPGAEAREVEETIEGMLLRLEEFCSLADVIRSDTSQILEENIPLLKAKVAEMRGIYARVDQLEAFVKMVGRHVSFLEGHVVRAERRQGALSQALRRWGWLGSRGLPSSRNNLPRPASPMFELPALFRTEDYFPADDAGPAAPQPRL